MKRVRIRESKVTFIDKWDGEWLTITALYQGKEYKGYGYCKDLFSYRAMRNQILYNISVGRDTQTVHEEMHLLVDM